MHAPDRELRIGLKRVYFDARAELPAHGFGEFLEWIETQLSNQVSDYHKASSGFDDLAGIDDKTVAVPYERELEWITARLVISHSQINTFLTLKSFIESATLAGDYESAIGLLEELSRTLGNSMWGVQLRIALEHQAGGLERQKRYVSNIRGVFKGGLLGFVAFHTSARNEDRTTAIKFSDDIGSRIERNTHFSSDVKTYLKFALAKLPPTSEEQYCEILRVEQNHSTIDVYETLVSLLQESLRNSSAGNADRATNKCLRALASKINDPRLQKAAFLLGDSTIVKNLPSRSIRLSDTVLHGDFRRAIRIFLQESGSISGTDPWQWIYAGVAYTAKRKQRNSARREPLEIPRLLANVFAARSYAEESFGQILKLTRNFSGLNLISGIADFLPILRLKHPDDALQAHLVGLNSPSLGPEDIPPTRPELRTPVQLSRPATPSITDRAWLRYLCPQQLEEQSTTTPEKMLHAAGLLREKEYQAAWNQLQTVRADIHSRFAYALVVSLEIRTLFHFGSRSHLIEVVAAQATRGGQAKSLVPIEKIFSNFSWEDFREPAGSLAAPVALHLWLMANENERIQSWLRYATSSFLRESSAHLPSKLIDESTRYDHDQLVYFLRHVCTPAVLDVSRMLRGTKAVLVERQAICASLRDLDPKNDEAYQAEILLISNQLAMQEGLAIVDQSRIHVDTNALLRWAERAQAEDFERYLDLAAVDLRPIRDFDEVLKELLDGPAQKLTFVPEDESDAILSSMLARIGEEFLLNPSYGFDFYLSKRVRHQSFIGLIRGPLEFSNLITTRESEGGDYRPYEFWIERFSSLSQNERNEINDALVNFGARFDEILLSAKEHLFHVRSHEKPQGLLRLELSDQHMALAKSVARQCQTSREFCEAALAILWAALEPSMASVRTVFEVDIQPRIARGFDELRATVRTISGDSQTFLEFDREVGLRSTEVQQALGDAARWFTRPSHDAQRRYFTLEQIVKISIDSVLKAHRAFAPKISTEVTGSLPLRATTLVFMHDVLFIAFDNARRHSGMKDPNVRVEVHANESEATLNVKVISQSRPGNRSRDEKGLQEIRQTITNRTAGNRARMEGKSGFLKLAATVGQSTKGKIDFGYDSIDQFYLSVTFSLIVHSDSLQGGQDD